jgi:hypothetical protein
MVGQVALDDLDRGDRLLARDVPEARTLAKDFRDLGTVEDRGVRDAVPAGVGRADVELRAARDHERRDDDHDVERVEEEHVSVCSTVRCEAPHAWRSSHPTAFSLRPS